MAEAYGLVFTLPDDLREIYLKFGIDLARGNGDGTWRLPVPARFVIDRRGIVRAVDADPVFELVVQDDQGVLDAFVHIRVLDLRLIQMRI